MTDSRSNDLSPVQSRVLFYIRDTIKHAGYPPTIKEMQAHFGWSSSNSVSTHLRRLVVKGAISIDRRKARGIKLLVEEEQCKPLTVTALHRSMAAELMLSGDRHRMQELIAEAYAAREVSE